MNLFEVLFWLICIFSFLKNCLVLFSCSVVSDFVTPWPAALQASLSFTNSQFALTHVH